MDPITTPKVHKLSWEKEQPTLKLNNKFYFKSLCKYSWSAINHSCLSDFDETYTLRDGANLSSKRTLHTRVKMTNFIFGNQASKQNLFNFSQAYTTDLGTIFIIKQSYTSIYWCNPSSDWDYKIVRNLPRVYVGLFSLVTKPDWGAPLLGLAKSIYYCRVQDNSSFRIVWWLEVTVVIRSHITW